MAKYFKVILTEYERGWGQKDFFESYFDTEKEAEVYADSVNSKNTLAHAPDYYIQARVEKF